MMKAERRRWAVAVGAVMAAGLVVLAGCSKDLMEPDVRPPTNSTITNPADGASLKSPTINVRGRAEVGATVEIFVNDEYQGSGESVVAVGDNPDHGGRFTVDGVELGLEGEKVIRAKVSDLYGNVATADHTPVVTVMLDQTPPPVELDSLDGTEWVEDPGSWGDGYWETGLPEIILNGRTDNTAVLATVGYGTTEFATDVFDSIPGEPDVRSFEIAIATPPLSGGGADTLIIYKLRAHDAAGNTGQVDVPVHWDVQGREEELSHDNGVYLQITDTVTGSAGQRVAVRFQAPTWANYVTKIMYYNANDNQDNPDHPDQSSTKAWKCFVWRVSIPDSLPGIAANEGYVPWPLGEMGVVPEDEWITVTLANPVRINDTSNFPDKKFYVGLEWLYRNTPHIWECAEQVTNPVDFKSFYYNWYDWDQRTKDTMIRAIVSDVESLDGREAVLTPNRVRDGTRD